MHFVSNLAKLRIFPAINLAVCGELAEPVEQSANLAQQLLLFVRQLIAPPLQLELRQRHEYAIALARDSFSEMRGAGQPTWVAKQMGHADWTMIARV